MSLAPLMCGVLCALAAGSLTWSVAPAAARLVQRAEGAVHRAAKGSTVAKRPRLLLVGLAWAVVSALALALGDRPDVAILILGALLAMPWLFLRRARGRRRRALEETQDALIVSWADALTTTPNLGEAIASSAEFFGEPLRGELDKLLAQMRLGVDIETALQHFSERLRLPGLEAATCAAILCRRTGGDLPGMLRRIAASTREIARLEGVVRTKTAEGRYQAWVMGGIPVGLLLLLDKLNPAWIAPLWQDPIGWVLLALAAVMEIAAVALIRKITSFEF